MTGNEKAPGGETEGQRGLARQDERLPLDPTPTPSRLSNRPPPPLPVSRAESLRRTRALLGMPPLDAREAAGAALGPCVEKPR